MVSSWADPSDNCWICLQDGDLTWPCKCPRPVHRQCLASWQLHAAGTREEVRCRFCSSDLPDWKLVLCGSAHTTHCCSVVPVVAVIFAGQEYRLAVQPTADGLQRFKKQVEVITGVPFTDGLDVRFFCRSPTGGYHVQLKGVDSLDAAMHCAAVTAAEREQKQHLQHRPAERQACSELDCTALGAATTASDLQDYDILQYWRAVTQAEVHNSSTANASTPDSGTASSSSSSSRSSGRGSSSSGDAGSNSSDDASCASQGCCSFKAECGKMPPELSHSPRPTQDLPAVMVVDMQQPELPQYGRTACLPFSLASVFSKLVLSLW